MAPVLGKRAVLLVVSLLVMTVISVLTGVYLSTIVTEKRGVEDERFLVQAVNLAEAGAGHAVADLRKRMSTDINARIASQTDFAYFNGYVAANNPLGFLRDTCYPAGGAQFAVNGTNATLDITPLNLTSGVAGTYADTRIRIYATQPPVADAANETCRFYYSYAVESTGRMSGYAQPLQKTVAFSPKPFTVVVTRDNFAKFALFTAHHRTTGGTRVWFTSNTNFYGPVHTNERFCFEGNPSARFTDAVTQHLQTAYFYNDGSQILADGDHNAAVDVPVFDQGYVRGDDMINLTSSLTQDDMKGYALGGAADPGNGIFVMNNGTSCTGGIYIRGNQGLSTDNANIAMNVDGNNRQVYTLNQGGPATSVVVDAAANRTIVTDASGTHTYTGVPDGSRHEGILIYANDDIGSLSGTVQADTKATIASERDIKITSHIRYQNYTASPLSAEGTGNLLGILSWGGNVRVGTSAPDNLEVHGVVMAPHGVFTVDNYNTGSDRGILTLLGGVITDFYGAFGTFGGMFGPTGYGRNFAYDTRMRAGIAPPYFPYMSSFCAFVEPANVLMEKVTWRQKDA